jgi:hypothetical protein
VEFSTGRGFSARTGPPPVDPFSLIPAQWHAWQNED